MLAKQFGIRGREITEMPKAVFVPFSAQTRMSGLDMEFTQYRKGAAEAIKSWSHGKFPQEVQNDVEQISKLGGTPLVVATQDKILGTIYLKDIVKGGLVERFKLFREMGIKTDHDHGGQSAYRGGDRQRSGRR